MEMLYDPPLVILTPFILQVYSTGGPPLVSPYRMIFGGVVVNDDDESSVIVLLSRAPPPVEKMY